MYISTRRPYISDLKIILFNVLVRLNVHLFEWFREQYCLSISSKNLKDYQTLIWIVVPCNWIMQRASPYATVRNKGLGKEQIRSNIRGFVINFLDNNNKYINHRNRRPTSCNCLDVFRTNEVCLDAFIDKLVKYEGKKSDERKLFLHGVLTHAHLWQIDHLRDERKTAVNALTEVLDSDGEFVHICYNSL